MTDDFDELSDLLDDRDAKLKEQQRKRDETRETDRKSVEELVAFRDTVLRPAFEEVATFLRSKGHQVLIEDIGVYQPHGYSLGQGLIFIVGLKVGEVTPAYLSKHLTPNLSISVDAHTGVATKRIEVKSKNNDSQSIYARPHQQEEHITRSDLTVENVKKMATDFVKDLVKWSSTDS